VILRLVIDTESDMPVLDMGKFRATDIATDPFPHIVVPRIVAETAMDEVLSALPAMRKGGSFPIGALRFGEAAKQLLAELQGDDFRRAVAEKFDLDLSDAPTMTTLRGCSREKDGRIHTDSVCKRVTVLVYLNRATDDWTQHQGCLRLLRGKESLDNYVAEVPPVDGAMLIFVNGPTAWHGHHRFVGQRYVMMMNYMANDNVARSELRRHQISAFVKRFT
jgi:SM-20-related protein